jgi:hypothetical protein
LKSTQKKSDTTAYRISKNLMGFCLIVSTPLLVLTPPSDFVDSFLPITPSTKFGRRYTNITKERAIPQADFKILKRSFADVQMMFLTSWERSLFSVVFWFSVFIV